MSHATRQPIALGKKPEWFKVRRRESANYIELKQIMRDRHLHTVCEEARCPNIYECWERRTATFMILGDTCTRACRFCSVKWGRPSHVDRLEPRRVADAVGTMGLKFAVVTSVNRDDLADGGAAIFADTIRAIHERVPDCGVEVLIPDFQGNWEALSAVVDARPEIVNHNVETVPRLFRSVQPWDSYETSLELFRQVRRRDPAMIIKTGVMVGLGEERDELVEVMRDLRACDVDVLTIGQYLPPSFKHFPLQRYYSLEEFAELREIGLELGFGHVESGPMVRSSYHARDQAEALTLRRLRKEKLPAADRQAEDN